jgi:hypothetical protein
MFGIIGRIVQMAMRSQSGSGRRDEGDASRTAGNGRQKSREQKDLRRKAKMAARIGRGLFR